MCWQLFGSTPRTFQKCLSEHLHSFKFMKKMYVHAFMSLLASVWCMVQHEVTK